MGKIWENVAGGENMIRIYCMEKKSTFNKISVELKLSVQVHCHRVAPSYVD